MIDTATFNAPKVALMQPLFLPWLGYFGLIADSDLFVFLDDFQLVQKSFGHRNKILLNGRDEHLITLPIPNAASHTETYAQVKPTITPQFKTKFLRMLRQNYSTSPWLDDLITQLELILASSASLADINIAFITWACEYCNITTNFMRSSTLDIGGQRSARVQALLDRVEAQTYLCARGAFGYMDEDGIFPLPTIQTAFQNFQPAPYPQKRAIDFTSHLSIVDTILQIGPEQTNENIHIAARRYNNWDEMKEAATS